METTMRVFRFSKKLLLAFVPQCQVFLHDPVGIFCFVFHLC